jgi:hypothetical protein
MAEIGEGGVQDTPQGNSSALMSDAVAVRAAGVNLSAADELMLHCAAALLMTDIIS